MSRRYGAPIGDCIKAVLPAFLKSSEEPAELPAPAGGPRLPPAWELTPGQSRALDTISQALLERRPAAFLLYGVPASGKTEVYLRLIRQVVDSGGQALFLVPEISLTGPFFGEFCDSLQAPVVLWHSRLKDRERRHSWLAIRRGQARVVVGARSAALLPFRDLRLAVLDEEQDESFKQEGQSPLYHARDVVLHRARACAAVTVLGSATPSLESWQAARRGEARLVDMPQRVSSAAKPSVTLLPLPPGRAIAPELLVKIQDRLARREQVILLVNRRGYATVLMCCKCGWVDRCASCGVAMIQHEVPVPSADAGRKEIRPAGTCGTSDTAGGGPMSAGFMLRCHHCTRQSPLPAHCPQCANPGLRVMGAGTQKVAAELRRFVPGARVLRMDRDTLSERGGGRTLYETFRRGEADILVGTKLVAKSFHFPRVTLVGVVDADTMLHMPDFRSSERTMQILAQVAGRSGRADKAGEVVLQTLQPEHIAVRGALRGDYAAFADQELALRRELGYPPFSGLVRLVWSGKDETALAAAAASAVAALREALSASGHEVVGPAAAVLPKARGRFRYHALVKVAQPELHLDAVLARVQEWPCPKPLRLQVNVDPYDLF
jgi:primosomal protein N' (replication factor Y)